MSRYEMFYDAALRVAYWEWLTEGGSAAQESLNQQLMAYIAVLDATPRAERTFRDGEVA